MLTKILITLLIIAGAMVYIRKPREKGVRASTKELGKNMKLRLGAYVLVSLSLTASAAYWYWDWSDGNKVVSVTIVSPMSEETVVYQVRKKDIASNELTTVNGIRIRLSNQERIIVANTVNK